MNRRRFLTAAGSFAASGLRLPQADAVDPAERTRGQALRVLLGRGQPSVLDAQTFIYEGRRYRGSVATTSSGDVISTVPLEAYLYSVVPREMPRSWPDAALRAQAIVARTYVLQRSSPNRAYDLTPSEADQVYTGIDAEAPETSQAVDATKGTVLRFGNGFADVMYSSCCGGHTEASSDAWGGPPLPYLRGVSCPYCTQSPWYAWTRAFSRDEIERAPDERIAQIGDVQTIALDAPDSSGRPLWWTFQGSNGAMRIKAADVRRDLGTRALPSLLVRSVDPGPNGDFIVKGNGLGHGVGMCQWGARGLAATGAGAHEILSFYYPGTGVQTI